MHTRGKDHNKKKKTKQNKLLLYIPLFPCEVCLFYRLRKINMVKLVNDRNRIKPKSSHIHTISIMSPHLSPENLQSPIPNRDSEKESPQESSCSETLPVNTLQRMIIVIIPKYALSKADHDWLWLNYESESHSVVSDTL